MSELSKQLADLIATRASTQEADPLFDLTLEMLRRNTDLVEALEQADRLVEQHGSAESALAALEYDTTEKSE